MIRTPSSERAARNRPRRRSSPGSRSRRHKKMLLIQKQISTGDFGEEKIGNAFDSKFSSSGKSFRRKRWQKNKTWRSRNKERGEILWSDEYFAKGGRGHGKKSRNRGVARALQFQSQKEKYQDLQGRVHDALTSSGGPSRNASTKGGDGTDLDDDDREREDEDDDDDDEDDEEYEVQRLHLETEMEEKQQLGDGNTDMTGTSVVRRNFEKLDLGAFEALAGLAAGCDLSAGDEPPTEEETETETDVSDAYFEDTPKKAAAVHSSATAKAASAHKLGASESEAETAATASPEPRKEASAGADPATQALRIENYMSETDCESNNQSAAMDDASESGRNSQLQSPGYRSPGYRSPGYRSGWSSPDAADDKTQHSMMNEEEFRSFVIELVFSRLFPKEEDELGEELDNFEISSAKRCLRRILFDPNARDDYVSIFWFVPADRLTDCFVTPTALSRAMSHMYEEGQADRGATLLVLKMVYLHLPHLEVQLLQVIHFSSYMYLEREQRIARCVNPAIFQSVPPEEDPIYSTLGRIAGLVHLWEFIVTHYVSTRLEYREEMVRQQEQNMLDGAENPLVWMGADPGQILFHILLNFLKSRVLLLQYTEPFRRCLVQLQRAYPPAPAIFFRKILTNWPRTHSKKAVLLLQWMPDIIRLLPPGTIVASSYLHRKLLKRIVYGFEDGHAQVALETLRLLQDEELLTKGIALDADSARQISEALSKCSDSHWNQGIREQCEDTLDLLLDYI